MNTNEEKLSLSHIAFQMEDVLAEMHKMHNMIKGARLYRDAVIKAHPYMTNECYEIFERAVRPLEAAFEEASKKHTELYDLSKGGK